MKRLANLVGFVSFSVVVTLVLTEVALRIFLALTPDPADSPYVRDPHCIYRLRPTPPDEIPAGSTDYINEFGFRDQNHARIKAPGSFRMLGIGDSFVYGVVHPEENFLEIAAAELDSVLVPRSLEPEMILMGLGAYSPENEVGVLRSLGLELDPDLVVLNFFVGNDVHAIPLRPRLYRGRLYYEGSPDPWLRLLRRSRLFLLTEHVLLTRIKAAILERRIPATQLDSENEVGIASEVQSDSVAGRAIELPNPSAEISLTRMFLHFQQKRIVVYEREPSKRLRKSWEEAEGYLLEFDRLCEEAEIPWLLHVIPTEIQVEPRVREEVLEQLDLAAEDYDFDLPQKRLREFAAQNAIPCADFLEELRSLSSIEDPLYEPNDTHWNRRGNEVVGSLLGRHLRTLLEPSAHSAQ